MNKKSGLTDFARQNLHVWQLETLSFTLFGTCKCEMLETIYLVPQEALLASHIEEE